MTVSSSQEIVETIFSAVRSGELAAGAPLPSIRSIAQAAGVSPGTVALAFRTLRDRGIITTTHGRRASVSAQPTVHRTLDLRVPEGAVNLSTIGPDPELLPDVQRLFTPDLYRPNLYNTDNVESSLGAVMASQFAADGIDASSLTVTGGALDALERLIGAQLGPGETVIVEDPNWASALSLLRALGVEAIGVPIDSEGMDPAALRAALAGRHCSALLLTPRAQNPYGSAMSVERAEALAAVLADYPEVFIIEDDHAGPISGAPATTLSRGRERWAVIRSVNKTFGPDLRVAVIASDARTAERVQGRQLFGPGWVSHFTQRLVARLLTDPGILAEVEDASGLYRLRRESLLAELRARGITAHGASGLNVLIPVPDETTVVSSLLTRGWAVRGGAAFRLNTPGFIRICISTLPVERAGELAELIADIIGSRPHGTAH